MAQIRFITKVLSMKYLIGVIALISLTFCLQALAEVRVVVIPLGDQGASGELSNIVTVAKEGGDFDSVEEAVDSILDATEDNPYLVYIAPGKYLLREPLRMKPWVRVVGSGIRTTELNARIVAPVGNSFLDCFSGARIAVIGSSFSVLSNLSIVNQGSAGETRIGICSDEDASSRVNNVSINVFNSSRDYGVFARGGLELDGVQIDTNSRTTSGIDSIGINAVNGNSRVNVSNSRIRSGGSTGQIYAVRVHNNAVELEADVYLFNSVVGDTIVTGADPVLVAENSQVRSVLTEGGGRFAARNSTLGIPVTGTGVAECYSTLVGENLLFADPNRVFLEVDCTLPVSPP